MEMGLIDDVYGRIYIQLIRAKECIKELEKCRDDWRLRFMVVADLADKKEEQL